MATHDFDWVQGEDLHMEFVYKQGEAQESATAVDLTDYSLRMDIVKQGTSVRLYTLNSAALMDPEDDDTEVVLGEDGTISIDISRAVTLSGGELFETLANATSFDYDIFLRNDSNKQKKILSGTITVEKSITLWA